MNFGRRHSFLLAFFLGAFFCLSANAQEPDKTEFSLLKQMNLEDLLNSKVQISSLKPLTTRKSPGVITLVTREQIVQSGARDLLEVLRLFFPGFQAMNLFQGMVIGGFRGIEHRMLFLLDGMEVTEEFAGDFPLGNEYPINSIERIEIMRGPGSVLYGGFASNAVVNIITRKVSGEGFLTYHGSRSKKSFTHNNLTMGVGKIFPGSEFNLTGMFGKGNRSDRNNVDYYGDSMTMAGNQKLNPEHLHLQFKADSGVEIQALAHNFLTSNINLWGVNHKAGPVAQSFSTRAFEIRKRIELGENKRWVLTPKLFYKTELPWRISVLDVAPVERYEANKRMDRVTAGFTLQGDLDPRTGAKFGYEASRFSMHQPENPGPYEEPFINGKTSIRFTRQAYFGELLHEKGPYLLSVGGRVEDSPQFGTTFVPRVSLTREWGKLNLKLANSRSLRIPSGIYLNRNPPGFPRLKSEKANTNEAEVGYRFSSNTYASVNLFDIKYRDLIQFTFDINSVGFFSNFGELGTHGLEFELMHNFKKIRTLLNYAYYRSIQNDVTLLQVPDDPRYAHGFPRHTLNLLLSADLGGGWWCNPSVSWVGKRHGYDHGTTSTNAKGEVTVTDVMKTYSPKAIWNLNFHKEYGNQGLSFDLGINDLFDSGYSFLSAYSARVAPMPAPTRAISVRAEIIRKF